MDSSPSENIELLPVHLLHERDSSEIADSSHSSDVVVAATFDKYLVSYSTSRN
jgi:hypothetical protein